MVFVVAAAMAFVVRTLIFEPVRVDGQAMLNTLQDHEFMIATKFDLSLIHIVDVEGRVALVTGGNGGIGGMFCRALAACGATVIVLGRNLELSLIHISMAMFSRMVPEESHVSCSTMPMLRRRLARVTARVSWPSTRISPASTS